MSHIYIYIYDISHLRVKGLIVPVTDKVSKRTLTSGHAVKGGYLIYVTSIIFLA